MLLAFSVGGSGGRLRIGSLGCVRMVRNYSARAVTVGRAEVMDGLKAGEKRAVRDVRRIATHKSGARFVFFDAPGPICSATIAVATKPVRRIICPVEKKTQPS